MKMLYILLLAAVCFAATLAGGKKYQKTVLYALAIGGAVNSNFFHAGAYPIDCFGLPFGIDSIIYTLFIYCVILALILYGKKEAYILTFSSCGAIMFSAIMQLCADLLTEKGIVSFDAFFNFTISTAASLLAVWAMLEFMSHLMKKGVNIYISIIVAIILATIINSTIYYGLSTLYSGKLGEGFIQLLLASFIGKLLATLFSVVFYYLLTKINNKKQS